ncbi:FtsQ-type POTRA domain-containing protein [Nisaea acidiphila]|uniref:Cell division protein FtsQ n=1 Tax=Nisaea acidiphila TaxID=1862145 RepID=A0A9J7APE8_9PROT|nr:cell division protein FtsQ/DivIB [Nisaea acidiphila]UUX49087.1 FtsQ-type POTRA domain-containing protein [Nisaea acidiphila]
MRLLSTAKSSKGKKTAAKRRQTRRPRLSARRMRQVLIGTGFAALTAIVAGTGWHAARTGAVGQLAAAIDETGVALSNEFGLVVSDILVEGRYRTERSQLVGAIATDRGTAILAVDLDALKARVDALPWVRTATIERRLPDTLFVRLEERTPLALWQRSGELTLIDDLGVEVPGQNPRRFADLPIVIGEDAPERARSFLTLLAREPDLNRRVRAVTWIGERRWTVRLDTGVDIELPERAPGKAWSHLAQLQRDHHVLDRDVVAIDLRLPNQLVVRVAPDISSRLRNPGKDT